MQPKTSSFSLQGIAPVGDEESWGDPAASTILAIAVFLGQVLISGVCLASEEALFVFSCWEGKTGQGGGLGAELDCLVACFPL